MTHLNRRQVVMRGQFPVHIRYKSYSTTLPLTVVAGSWEEIGSLKSVLIEISIPVSESSVSPAITEQLHTTIQSHSALFKDELGTINGISAKLEMKVGASRFF